MMTALALILSASPVDSIPAGPPLEYKRVSSTYGYRRFDHRFHPGIDLAAKVGTTVRATAAGKVVQASEAGTYGLLVIVDHGGGLRTWFAHLSKKAVKVGQSVKTGQKIGEVGSTGLSTGPHCHYEVRLNGVPQDPAPFIWEDRR